MYVQYFVYYIIHYAFVFIFHMCMAIKVISSKLMAV